MKSDLTRCLCGISDEAGRDLDSQIRAHRELGWNLIELRSVDGLPVVDLSPNDVERIRVVLKDNGLRVAALSTGIGGWKRTVRTSFQRELDELARATDYAHKLGTRFLRIMSFANDGLTPERWRAESLERIAELVEKARSGDVVLLHENCQGWASQGPDETIEMLRQIDSPHLRLLFDIGNPVVYGQDGLSFLHSVAKWVEHVHIKDAARKNGGEITYTLPGDGQARVALCLDALFRSGYQGVFSIEPHRAFIPHLSMASDEITKRDTYVLHGRRFRALLEDLLNAQRNML